MRKIIVIGTLHAGITPNQGLEEALKDHHPDQILVEIAQDDIDNNKIETYPPEMIFAYQWALKNNIKVNGFDSKINTLKKGMGEEDNQKAIEKQTEIMQGFTWKDMNKPENNKKLDIKEAKILVDHNKENKRNREMLQNINNLMLNEGVIVILTGCGHLDFFEKNLQALFPYR